MSISPLVVSQRLVLLLCVSSLALLALACGEDLEGTTVRISGLEILVEVAQTGEERAKGLSGRESLAEGSGMLFVLEDERQPSFWMKGMLISLDFIWISSDLRVADLTEHVPPPVSATADADLPRYQPDQPVRYVLEVNAGVVQEAGIQIGDTVVVEPELSTPELSTMEDGDSP